MNIPTETIITFAASFLGGGSVGFSMVRAYMHSEAKKALKPEFARHDGDIEELKTKDDALHKRINHVENEYVQCRYCDMQHDNLKTTLDGINHKLDIILEQQMR